MQRLKQGMDKPQHKPLTRVNYLEVKVISQQALTLEIG